MQNKRPFIFLATSFIVSGLILTCAWSGDDGIIGTWTASVKTPGERPATIQVSYKRDGTAWQSTDSMGHVVKGSYTYTVRGNHITETLTGTSFDGKALVVAHRDHPTADYTFKIDGKTLRLNGVVAGREIAFSRVN